MGEQELRGQAEQIEEMLEEGLTQDATALLSALHPNDAASVITELHPKNRATALLLLEPEMAAEVVEELDDDVRTGAIKQMPPERAALILGEMYTDEEADVLQDLPSEHAEAIIKQLETQDAADVRELIQYDEDTAGGLMQKEFIAVPLDYTASATVVMLRTRATEFADFPVGYIYAVDEIGRLKGVVTIRSLLLCEANATIEQILEPRLVSIHASMEATDVVEMFERENYLAIPVVDGNGRLVGTILQEDVLRFEIEEGEEELMRASGIVGGEELREMPILVRALRRFMWLGAKTILNLLPIAVISAKLDELRALTALVIIMPVVSDMGGGAGSQAIAVSIRELTMDRINQRDYWEVLLKEVSVGVLNGILLAGLFGGIIWFWFQDSGLGALAATAIGLNTVVAVLVGGTLPLLLRRMKIDPATASSPILTMVTDTVGFWLVLTMARSFVPY